MTYKKLAEITGFSVSTISKAFSQSNEISEDSKEKIFSVAKDLGCFDKYYKEKYNKKVVAVICPEFKSRFMATFTETMVNILNKNDYLATISVSGFNADTERELIEYYSLYAKADAIILISASLGRVKNYSIPIVSVGGLVENIDSVLISLDDAVCNALKLLKDNGHTRIAFLGERLTQPKEKLFVTTAKKIGLDVPSQYIVKSKKRFEDVGREGMEYLLSLPEPPTAVVTAYDHIAIGAMHTIKAHGLSIPNDISIIGIDDIDDTENTTPALTSIKPYIADISALAVDIITKKINNPYFKAIQKTEVNAQLIIRDSVGFCNPKDNKPMTDILKSEYMQS